MMSKTERRSSASISSRVRQRSRPMHGEVDALLEVGPSQRKVVPSDLATTTMVFCWIGAAAAAGGLKGGVGEAGSVARAAR
jgi:hypothetical protein